MIISIICLTVENCDNVIYSQFIVDMFIGLEACKCSEKSHLFWYESLFHNYSKVISKDMARLLQIYLQPSLFSYFLFSCISSQFSPLFSISFLILSIHLVLDLPLGHFPFTFVWSIFLDTVSSAICITFPNHLNLLFWMSFLISSNFFFCIRICFDGVVIIAQCTATFSDLLCSPEFRYY